MSFVYFIQAGDGGPIKIGFSTNVQSRLSKIQTDLPMPAKCLAIIRGDKKVERQFHNLLSSHRIRGEWFSPARDVLSLIAEERASDRALPLPVVFAHVASPQALLKRSGLSKAYASQIARGLRKPSLRLAVKIFQNTGLRYGSLVGATDADVMSAARITSSEAA